MSNFETRVIWVGTVAWLTAHSATVLAQTVAPEGSSGNVELETVMVTAQRRAENLQDVPIAVTALNAKALGQMGVDTTQELQTAVPGLVYSQAGARSQAYLRGVGNNISFEGADPSVATYIDGVYVPSNAATVIGLLGVERIEVLKGPQGTLYGRNATGGAISVITRSPVDHFEGTVSAGYGNYSRQELAAFVGGPVSDNLRLSVDAAGTRRDPYMAPAPFPSGVTNLPDLRDEESEWATRVKAIYDPTSWLTLTASGDYTEYRSYEDVAWRQFLSNATGYANGAAPNPGRHSNSTTNPIHAMFDAKSASLRGDIDLGSTRIMALSAYRDVAFLQNVDSDSTHWRPSGVELASNSESISHELQWQSVDSPVEWVVGVFAYSQKALSNPNRSFNADLRRFQEQFGRLDTTSYSGFVQTMIPLGASWRTTLGVRYTDESKDVSGIRQTYNPTTQAPLVREQQPFQEKSWGEWTPKVVIDYRIADTMFYASYSRGFKSGVFNVGAPEQAPVDPEFLEAYELGMKSELLGRRLRLNTSVYYYDYTDLQVSFRRLDPNVPGSATSSLQNAATAEITGVDLETQFVLTRNLTLNASLSYIDSEYTDFGSFNGHVPAAVGNQTVAVDVTGHRLPRAADWSGTLGGRYEWQSRSGAQVNATASWYYNSGYNFLPDDSLKQPRFDTANAAIEFVPAAGPWRVSLWGKNLTNHYYWNFQQIVPQGNYGSPAAPRTFGASVTLDF